MKKIVNSSKLYYALLTFALFFSCSDDDNTIVISPTNTVVDVAVSNDYTFLAAALQRADLVTTLQGEGPFTVFAPTNTAFEALLDSNPNWNGIDDIPEATLTAVLLNHVIADDIPSSALINAGSGYANVESTGPNNNKLSLYYNVENGVVQLNGGAATAVGANVTNADLMASNGVVHEVNKILLPPTVVDHAIANTDFEILVDALTTATPNVDFVTILSDMDSTNGNAPFTIFAPNNMAFQNLLDSNMAWNTLTDVANAVDLPAVLQHHVLVNANVQSANLTDGVMPETLEGDTITINLGGNDGNPAKITDGVGNTDIDIIAVDVQASNGVIHVIEDVLLPNFNN